MKGEMFANTEQQTLMHREEGCTTISMEQKLCSLTIVYSALSKIITIYGGGFDKETKQ